MRFNPLLIVEDDLPSLTLPALTKLIASREDEPLRAIRMAFQLILASAWSTVLLLAERQPEPPANGGATW